LTVSYGASVYRRTPLLKIKRNLLFKSWVATRLRFRLQRTQSMNLARQMLSGNSENVKVFFSTFFER